MTEYIRTTDSPSTLIEMFLDGTPNEVYNNGRLYTRQNGRRIQLVAYGNEVLAAIDRAGENVELYTGHHEQVSETVTGYIETLGSILSGTGNRDVSAFREAAPTLGYGTRVSRSAKYIGNFVRFVSQTERSPVERDAVDEVNEALAERLAADPGIEVEA